MRYREGCDVRARSMAKVGLVVVVLIGLSLLLTGCPGLPLFTLTVTKIGLGSGTVLSWPLGIDCGTDCTESYLETTVVSLTAAPDASSRFARWSGDCSGTDNVTTVTMDADKTCTADFGPKFAGPGEEWLTVGKDEDDQCTVTSSPAGINCGPGCDFWSWPFPVGTVVTLSVALEPGWYFGGWSGDCWGTGNCSVTMNSYKFVAAHCSTYGYMPCFRADTKVLMADGSYKRIADIEVGDMVMSYDRATQQQVASKVEQTFRYQAEGYLKINDLEVTESHSFAVGPDQAVEAGQLKVGDRLTLGDRFTEITRVKRVNQPTVVYNLIVAGTGIFYVSDGYDLFPALRKHSVGADLAPELEEVLPLK